MDDEEHAKQAINYSWNRGITYAVLTDFEALKVFNAQRIEKRDLMDKLVFEIPCADYLNDFETLWLLSRESFLERRLDAFAEKHGKKEKSVSVSTVIKKLNEDIQWARGRLTESFDTCNQSKHLSQDLISEGVQKLLDRLLFLRVAEDRGVEPDTLKNFLREAERNQSENQTAHFQVMVSKFRELDKIYDSNLFSPHPFEEWDIWDGGLTEVIHRLYGHEGHKGYYEYNFKEMPADVLGTVYEGYLGSKLAIAIGEKNLFGETKGKTTASKDARKRKEQGIFYTPPFIVDYIVRNALKPILDSCKNVSELRRIKVLDPACGSGSFLIKVLEAIAEQYETSSDSEYVRKRILSENLYGVDLDQQAVEIARLNLLIHSLNTRELLPPLDKNIKNGNSLISGTDKELDRQFGKNWRDKKPFNWSEEFPEVFKQGGFDVIVGNPPYIKEFVNKSAFDGLHESPYYQGKMDLWTLFACVSIDLLKEGGTMSFIAPNNWVSNAGASILRDKILKEGELKTFIDFGDYKVFEQAGIQTMIYVFEKRKPRKKYEVEYFRVANKNIAEEQLMIDMASKLERIEIEPEKLIGKNITFSTSESGSIFDKLENQRNFNLTDEEISNGIHHHHDAVNKDRQEILGNNFVLGEGIFVLSDSEKNKLLFNRKELGVIKPSYTTEELGRWYGDPQNKEWVVYTDSSFKDSKKIDSYPNIKKHLDKFKAVITSDNKPYGLHRAKKEKFFQGEKIIALRKCAQPTFTYVNFDSYVSATFYIIKSDRINQKYLTAILNSNLTAFWLKYKGKMQGNNYQLDKEPLINIPIRVGDEEQQKEITVLVDKMLALQKELHEEEEHSEKWKRIKSDIEKTDRKIDEAVYKLYELTDEEIKIVENTTF